MHRVLPLLPLVAALCGGCVSVSNSRSVTPPPGLYSDFSAPLTAITEPIPCEGLRSGTATQSVYVWIWPFGPFLNASDLDMALETAIRNGNLEKVYFADYRQNSFFGFVTKFTVTAYGE